MSESSQIKPGAVTKSDFDFIRLKLLDTTDKVHWVQLQLDLQERLVRCFSQISISELASEISYDEPKLEVFLQQRSQLELLQKEIAEERNRHLGSRYINYSDQTREKIYSYFNFVSVNRLASIVGVPRSTLDEWKKRAEKKESHTDSINEVGVGEISKNDITQQLRILFKRHEGKPMRRYTTSEKELILKLVDGFGSKSVHDELKVSYDTIARLKRERERGQPKLASAVKYAPVIETMKKYPGMGPMQVRDYVHRYLGLSMGVNSVRKVMEDQGWISSYSRRVKVNDEVRRYESIRRNHLWHVDFKHFFINKCKAYLLFIEDDHSRFITGHCFADGERVEAIIDTLQESTNRHGLPQMIMSDGGSAFHAWRGQSRFNQFLEDFGIDHYVSKLPRVNGKVESINQKIEKEVLDVKSFSSINHLQEELIRWIWFYNFKRPHQGLDGLQVPADRFYPSWNTGQESTDNTKILVDAVAQIVQQLKTPA